MNARRPRGFTLVEMLIALVLLALLMLVLTSALRAVGQVEDRVDQRIEAADDYRAATALLTEVVGRVSARRQSAADGGVAAQMPFFQAGADSLAWIGVMPARYGLGGRHYLRLGLEPGDDGAHLVLRYAPWTGAPGFAAWGQAAAHVLATPVQGLSLQYLEPISGQWSADWPPAGATADQLPRDLLPSAVAIQVEGAVPPWPPLIVAVMPTASGRYLGFTGDAGGGSRAGGG